MCTPPLPLLPLELSERAVSRSGWSGGRICDCNGAAQSGLSSCCECWANKRATSASSPERACASRAVCCLRAKAMHRQMRLSLSAGNGSGVQPCVVPAPTGAAVGDGRGEELEACARLNDTFALLLLLLLPLPSELILLLLVPGAKKFAIQNGSVWIAASTSRSATMLDVAAVEGEGCAEEVLAFASLSL